MPITYVTMGQAHTHRVSGITVDADCVVRITAEDRSSGRGRAHELFGEKFSFSYFEDEWNVDDMKYFPRGYVDLQ
ncbi:hypothetical protein NVP1031O_112 [Vibrio phage 1.031.O._10N.261.46.F8]|nr:hypothetical protein NVP1031O_112 [Vibrio phage 1.031.O._10N.261.46.F8]